MKYAIALILALALALPAFAGYTYQTAKHSYYIDVRNSNFRDIWGAYVTVSESGTHSAYVNVRAQGYRDAHGYVSINPSQHSVHVQIRMEDPTVFVRVQNRAGQNINCSVDQNQFMANADEYLLKIRMPSEGFLKFEPRDVRVDFFYGCWVNVWGSSGSRQVEIKIPRRNFGYGFSVNIRVTIPTDAELQQMKREALRKANFDTLEARSRP